MHGHEVRPVARQGVPPTHEIFGTAGDDGAGHRRVQLDRARGEQHLTQMHERPREPAHVAFGELVRHQRRAQPRQRDHPTRTLAADCRVVHGDVLPMRQRVGVVGVGVGKRERDVTAATRRAADRQAG